jgi:hypothetical protein
MTSFADSRDDVFQGLQTEPRLCFMSELKLRPPKRPDDVRMQLG